MMDIQAKLQMDQLLKAMEKMHNGLVALIDEFQRLEERVKELENNTPTQQGN